ncbi:MAG: zf-HC2 domain-containing protein [Armatimonadetes bacterium]|nr:zf-HC2 domain-containing protein [Armatimonadota bacterium]
MNCNQVEPRLSEFIDRELSGAEMLEIRRHLDRCSKCQVVLDELRDLKAIVGSPMNVEIPEGLEDRLVSAVMSSKPKRADRPWLLGFSTAMVAATIVYGALYFFGQPDQPQTKEVYVQAPTMSVADDQARIAASDSFGGTAPVFSVSNTDNGR